jgi:hypothetical protein
MATFDPPSAPRSDDETGSAFATLQPDRLPAALGLPAVIDVEASGFGRHSYPIEVGFVLEDGRCGCTLIRPEPDWTHWDPAAEHTHGIGRDLLVRHGRPAGDVARWLNQHLAGRVVYTDGWAHDYPWLGRLFDAAQISPRFRVGHLRDLLDDASAATWQARLSEVRALQDGQRHRASVDARHIRAALARSLEGR